VLGFLIGAWVVPCMQTHASLIWRPNHEHTTPTPYIPDIRINKTNEIAGFKV
jgi:hypothetical protein